MIVLDGWGHGKPSPYNAIHVAKTPVWDHYWTNCPRALLSCSGEDVGLPAGQMGNSEVGHLTIGAGRVVDQDLSRIDKSIADRSFFNNRVLKRTSSLSKDHRVHVLGLLSPGGVHSHENQIWSLVEFLAESSVPVSLHAFLDGRDSPPKSAGSSLEFFESKLAKHPNAEIASICGRYYAMDRDARWDRTRVAYEMLVGSSSPFCARNSLEALEEAYERGESDEFVRPTRTRDFRPVRDGDAVIFMNFRADRARQLSRAFVIDEFCEFDRSARPQLSQFVTLTPYAKDISSENSSIEVLTLLERQRVRNSFGECIANSQLSQLRIAESEKSAHVTYFFSGGTEQPFANESRRILPSPQIPTYDLQPSMSAESVTSEVVNSVLKNKYSVVICNFANGDMVGHTGNLNAAVDAVECLDDCLGRILDACKATGSNCFVTADHGNVENMYNRNSQQPDTAHTTNLVPFVYVGPTDVQLADEGSLADVAPTMLDIMNLAIPAEMTGKSLAIKHP